MKSKSFGSEQENILLRKTIKKFDSFEEMNEEDAREKAALSPIEHLQNATSLIEKLYAEELKKPMDKKIRWRQ